MIVQAGPNVTVAQNATIELQGSVSGPGGPGIRVQWVQVAPAQPVAILSAPTQLTTLFRVPDTGSLMPVVITMQLKVVSGWPFEMAETHVTVLPPPCNALTPYVAWLGGADGVWSNATQDWYCGAVPCPGDAVVLADPFDSAYQVVLDDTVTVGSVEFGQGKYIAFGPQGQLVFSLESPLIDGCRDCPTGYWRNISCTDCEPIAACIPCTSIADCVGGLTCSNATDSRCARCAPSLVVDSSGPSDQCVSPEPSTTAAQGSGIGALAAPLAGGIAGGVVLVLVAVVVVLLLRRRRRRLRHHEYHHQDSTGSVISNANGGSSTMINPQARLQDLDYYGYHSASFATDSVLSDAAPSFAAGLNPAFCQDDNAEVVGDGDSGAGSVRSPDRGVREYGSPTAAKGSAADTVLAGIARELRGAAADGDGSAGAVAVADVGGLHATALVDGPPSAATLDMVSYDYLQAVVELGDDYQLYEKRVSAGLYDSIYEPVRRSATLRRRQSQRVRGHARSACAQKRARRSPATAVCRASGRSRGLSVPVLRCGSTRPS